MKRGPIKAALVTGIILISGAFTYGQLNFNTKDSIVKNQRFHNNGLYVAERKILFMSIPMSPGGDTIYYHSFFPEIFLYQYRAIGETTDGKMLVSNGADTLSVAYNIYTPEEYVFQYLEQPVDSLLWPALDSFIWNNNIYITLQGVVDTTGKMVQPLVYDKIITNNRGYPGEQPVYPFIYKNKVGFMDSAGTIIIKPEYDNVFESFYFSDGFRSETDEVELYRFFYGVCEVIYKGKQGIINQQGAVILPFIYKHIQYDFYSTPNKIIASDIENKIHTFDFNGNKLPE